MITIKIISPRISTTLKNNKVKIHKLFIKNDIILIQEHWLFQAQIHLIGELHSQINYAAKGVDINDPLLPISMPRGYGGVAVIWKNEIDHLVRPIQKENSPAKSSRKHLRSPSDKIVYRF